MNSAATTKTMRENPVRSARQAAGLTQAQLAVKANVSPSTVSLAERAGLLTRPIAEKLAAVLGCTPEELRS